MYCKKCNGRVCIDRTFSEKKHVELWCLGCGKRWMLSKDKSTLAQWLLNIEVLRLAG